jgi:hypothetical protein
MRARDWLDGELNGSGRVGLPWASTLAFIRIGSNPRAFPNAPSSVALWRQVQSWLSCDSAWVPQETARHADVLHNLLESSGATGNLVTDAYFAALAIEHGLTVCSADADFARFPNLKWINPIAV